MAVSISIRITNIAEVIQAFNVIRVYRSTGVDSDDAPTGFAEITTTANRIPLIAGRIEYTFTDPAGEVGQFYTTDYFNLTSSASSAQSAPVRAAQTDGTITAVFTGVRSPRRIARVPEVDPESLIDLIEARGTRIGWARAAACPCELNTETNQPSFDCPRCNGLGWFYFGPAGYSPPEDVGLLTTLQQAILTEDGAAVIRGLVQRIGQTEKSYTVVGPWETGELMVSVRPQNKIGHYDRITLLDAVITFDQVLEIPNNGTLIMPLRYRAVAVNAIFSTTERYTEDVDFTVDALGRVAWLTTGPTGIPYGQRVSVHYLTHPTYLITNRPHAMRQTSKYRREQPRITPLGNPQELPLQGQIQLEFLRDQKPEATT